MRHGVSHGRVEQDRVLAMDLQHAAELAHHAQGVVQVPIVDPEVEDHERLAGRDPGVDDRRELGDRVVHPPADGQAQAVVNRAVGIGRGSPFAR